MKNLFHATRLGLATLALGGLSFAGCDGETTEPAEDPLTCEDIPSSGDPCAEEGDFCDGGVYVFYDDGCSWDTECGEDLEWHVINMSCDGQG